MRLASSSWIKEVADMLFRSTSEFSATPQEKLTDDGMFRHFRP